MHARCCGSDGCHPTKNSLGLFEYECVTTGGRLSAHGHHHQCKMDICKRQMLYTYMRERELAFRHSLRNIFSLLPSHFELAPDAYKLSVQVRAFTALFSLGIVDFSPLFSKFNSLFQ